MSRENLKRCDSWPLVLENDDGIRPAGDSDRCFYCGMPEKSLTLGTSTRWSFTRTEGRGAPTTRWKRLHGPTSNFVAGCSMRSRKSAAPATC